jgi:transposase
VPASDEANRELLKQLGAWNAAWDRVQAAVFGEHPDFCDRENLVQVKYEMLRAHYVEGLPVADAARAFGFSRQTFYLTDAAFAAEGFHGLLARKRGPKHPRKLTDEMVDYVLTQRERIPGISALTLTDELQARFRVTIHPRSIQRLLKKKLLGRAPANPDQPVRGLLAVWRCAAGRVRAGAQHRIDGASVRRGSPVRAHHRPALVPARRECGALACGHRRRPLAGMVRLARPTAGRPTRRNSLATRTNNLEGRRRCA